MPTEATWSEIRADFDTLASRVTYLNAGEFGIPPRSVLQVKRAWETLVRSVGPGAAEVTTWVHRGVPRNLLEDETVKGLERWEGVDRLRTKLAELVGVQSDEVVFTRNTSEAIAKVIESLPGLHKKTVLLTDIEHDAGVAAKYFAAQHREASTRIVPISDIIGTEQFGEECVHRFQRHLSDDTRLVIVSHILYNCGVVLPIKEIVQACRKYPRVRVLVDGAHTIGHIPVNLDELSCDFYVSAGHKWLCAPKGSGFLFCRDWVWEHDNLKIWPTGAFDLPDKRQPRPAQLFGNWPLRHGAGRFDRWPEFGTVDEAVLIGLNEALDYYTRLGVKEVSDRITYLSQVFHKKLAEMPYVKPFPRNGIMSSGLISIRIDGVSSYDEADALVKQLSRKKIICRAVPDPPGVRISLHYFNNEEDIERLCESLEVIVAQTIRHSV